MNANPAAKRSPGTVFYDGECGFCHASLRRFGGPFRRAGFVFTPCQEALASGTVDLPPEEFANEMKLRRCDGRWFGGAEAWLEMCASVGWLRPVAWLGRWPGILHLLRWTYRRIAANRHGLGGRCPLPAGDN
jgi:predicted DCC family thiol-disulfide oxidoreductase YuxK